MIAGLIVASVGGLETSDAGRVGRGHQYTQGRVIRAGVRPERLLALYDHQEGREVDAREGGGMSANRRHAADTALRLEVNRLGRAW